MKHHKAAIKRKLAAFWKTAKLTANLMAGVPDYENYVAQQRRHNPNAPVMSEQHGCTNMTDISAQAAGIHCHTGQNAP